MRCVQCGQVSDWLGEESGWNALQRPDGARLSQLYVCSNCGNQQRVR